MDIKSTTQWAEFILAKTELDELWGRSQNTQELMNKLSSMNPANVDDYDTHLEKLNALEQKVRQLNDELVDKEREFGDICKSVCFELL